MQRLLSGLAAPNPRGAEPGPAPDAEPSVDEEQFAALARECGWSLGELKDQYLRQMRETLEGTQAALESGEADRVARLAHGGVGPSGSCGTVGLMELFRRIEQAGRKGRLDAAAQLLRKTRQEFERVRKLLERMDEATGS
ncbi:MAG: Hpt domain-containing protein [Planctomycetota bacterium]